MAAGASVGRPVLRLTRYLLRFPLWEDEAMLSANLIDRGYRDLLQPLHYCQVVPTLFLWGQLTIVKLLGFNEYSLRLIPFLCGLVSLPLFRHVAGRLLQGAARVLAVGLFAVAYPMTRYAAEAKPYGCDLLIALAFLALTVEWLRRPDQTRWLWALAALVGPAVGYSFPAIFVAGGASLVIAWRLFTRGERERLHESDIAASEQATRATTEDRAEGKRRQPDMSSWVAWLVYNIILVACFAAVLVVSRHSVGAVNEQTMEETHWAASFPPITQPLKLPLWLLQTHAGAMLGYPVGGPNWGSTFSLLCVVAGVVLLRDAAKGFCWDCLLAPLGLNFIAAAVHRFPYGGHARMTLFLAPTFCTLIALGLATGLTWIEELRWSRRGAGGTPSGSLGMASLAVKGTVPFLPTYSVGAPQKSGQSPGSRDGERHGCLGSAGGLGGRVVAPRRNPTL